MSYGFSMAFTPCNSFERALMIGAQCSDLLRKPENTKHLINDNLIFLPSLRYHDDVNPFSDGNWLHRFFTMRFVYWDSQKILGLVMDNPEAVSYTHLDVYKRQGVSGPSTDALILLAVAVGCAYLCVSAYAHGGKDEQAADAV